MAMYQVFYKNFEGKWVPDQKFPRRSGAALRRLEKIRKTKALNGQVALQEISK